MSGLVAPVGINMALLTMFHISVSIRIDFIIKTLVHSYQAVSALFVKVDGRFRSQKSILVDRDVKWLNSQRTVGCKMTKLMTFIN